MSLGLDAFCVGEKRGAEAKRETDRFRLFCKLIVITIQAPQGLLGDIGNVILKLIWQRKCSKQPKKM